MSLKEKFIKISPTVDDAFPPSEHSTSHLHKNSTIERSCYQVGQKRHPTVTWQIHDGNQPKHQQQLKRCKFFRIQKILWFVKLIVNFQFVLMNKLIKKNGKRNIPFTGDTYITTTTTHDPCSPKKMSKNHLENKVYTMLKDRSTQKFLN